jgi:Cof subfamily protein (haloacid dehalogenase superfamily)
MDRAPVSVLSARKEQCPVKENPATEGPLYRMVALDLDGTLLQSNHKMSDVQAAYLRSLHAQGFTVCIATGRSAPSVYEHLQKLNLPEPIPVVCSNGARGFYYNASDLSKQELFYNPVPKSVVHEALRIAKENGCAVQYYYEDSIYVTATGDDVHRDLTAEYSRLTGSMVLPVEDDFKSLLDQDHLPSKLLVIFDESFFSTAVEIYSKELESQATIVLGILDWFLEILNPQVTKGHGLRNMCSSLNIPIEECIAMGDGANDLEFLQFAGLGIAMKNGKDTVKNVADSTMEWTNDQHGVMKSLQRLDEQGLLCFKEDTI